jgi:ABC-type Na+ efflux pump permease subunit
MKLLAYFAVGLLQMCVTYNFGNELTVSSNKLSLSLFGSDWIDEGKEFKTAMTIFLENTKKPLVIKAGLGVFKVDLPTFLWIFNSA